MVSRIMLSLRKQADTQRRGSWSLVDPTGNGLGLRSMKFVVHPQGTINEGQQQGDTQIDAYVSRGVDDDPAGVGMP